jgi:hypothetical protein
MTARSYLNHLDQDVQDDAVLLPLIFFSLPAEFSSSIPPTISTLSFQSRVRMATARHALCWKFQQGLICVFSA